MLESFFTGFFLGISLIVAIGAQNAFVIRQGLLKQHVFYIALFCALSDSLLIIIGVLGISFFFNNIIDEFLNLIFGFSALWLFIYGLFKLRSSLSPYSSIKLKISNSTSLINSLSIVAVFTFANPHVYLDTMILIGSVSQQFVGINKLHFTIGSCLASFVWFYTLSYGASKISPLMTKSNAWHFFDFFIALIMFTISFNLARSGNWI